ncbi:MAG: hypothetical protein A2W55_02955 [Candidatus Nealsonbacteria bacterium RIFCSPHIGHO2_02_38_10]|nr:MAG: hypothetical protein A2W55_02955 [Candidatus Nealsonbacteria bacterium RIFCSPHIGHO2_02_38_10]
MIIFLGVGIKGAPITAAFIEDGQKKIAKTKTPSPTTIPNIKLIMVFIFLLYLFEGRKGRIKKEEGLSLCFEI